MTDKKKAKRIKKEKYQTEEQTEIIRFVKILVAVIIIVLGVYILTRIFVTKDLLNDTNTPKQTTAGQINYEITNIGSMLNKKEKEYYVIMYSSENLDAVYYSTLASKYSQNKNALKIYYANLDTELNQMYVDADKENLNPVNLEDFKVSNLALIKIKDNKIEKSFNTENEIATELANK
ncbi:MAG: hypothetical protein E7163_04980 [Firmicutes bacterium]|nr:hypothetical protein [Bacillota bacterium]